MITSLRFYPEFSCKQLADHLFPGQGRCRCQGPETRSRSCPAPLGPQLQVPHSGWHLKGAWWWIGWNNKHGPINLIIMLGWRIKKNVSASKTWRSQDIAVLLVQQRWKRFAINIAAALLLSSPVWRHGHWFWHGCHLTNFQNKHYSNIN